MTKKNFSLLLLIGLLVILGEAIPVKAAVIQVTTTSDSVPGSLREAITLANTNGQANTIMVPLGTYVLSGAFNDNGNVSGDLDFYSSHKITIVGAGTGQTIIDGNLVDRVLHIISGEVSITGVTILNGKTRDGLEERGDGASGGGIFNSGTLTLQDCAIQENRCGNGYVGAYHYRYVSCPGAGGSGGGIYNMGSLTLSRCRIEGNIAGHSGGAIDVCDDIPRGGHGGGIYNSETGNLVMDQSIVSNNSSGQGTSGGADHDVNNRGGDGGGICNLGSQTLTHCTISYNFTGIGGFGTYPGGDSGSSGDGGGIYDSGSATLRQCTIKNNFTGAKESSWVVEGAGGGIYNKNPMTLENCTISNNHTGAGADGGGIHHKEGRLTLQGCTVSYNYTGDATSLNKKAGGAGGGIYNHDELVLINTTVSNNKTGKGSLARYNDGGDGGNGGGICVGSSGSKITLIHCTIAGNSTGSGGIGDTLHSYQDGIAGFGGGIYSAEGLVQANNTIIGDNKVYAGGRGPDGFCILTSLGYNLVETLQDCEVIGTLTGNKIGVDALLAPLADNGGPTATHALLVGSPAIDAGYRAGYSVDQRGYARPVDIPTLSNVNDGTDIGAYEKGLAPIVPPRLSLNPHRLVFGGDVNGNKTGAQTLLLTNSGAGTLTWTATSQATWLSCHPAAGSGAASLTISVNPTGMNPGTFVTALTISDPHAENSPQSVEVVLVVYASGSASAPIGTLDTPVSGANVSGSIPVTGWAVDDVGIKGITLYREPITGEGSDLIFIGNGIRVEGARPDVALLYPDYPESSKAGWGYMLLTNFLPAGGNGSFTLQAVAEDIEGNRVTLGKTVIVCDNAHAVKPFGAIDSPAQGGTASGSQYINFGWALTPLPNVIPTNGATISVWVDGVEKGHPVYNQAREDIITLFPGYHNSAGAVGYYYLDTRFLTNGVHTIAWSVMDNAGNTEGIGSRYFTVQNTGTDAASSSSQLNSVVSRKHLFPKENDAPKAIWFKTGYNPGDSAKAIYPDGSGQMVVRIQELERLEIHFGNHPDIEFGTISIQKLPIGSFLDAANGVFYWQPGVGFVGEYPLIFQVTSPTDDILEKEIIVQIVPRG